MQPSNLLKELSTIYIEETMDLTQQFLENKSLDDILHKSSVQSENAWPSHRCGEKALQSLVNNRNEKFYGKIIGYVTSGLTVKDMKRWYDFMQLWNIKNLILISLDC